MSTPLVSVLMTVHNRENYIAEAIESVIASTYQNWELIIVDDQSKDYSVDIAKSYAKNDNRIRVYVNLENLGDYPNRNRAASYAKGKYLKYVDADDMIYPYGLEQLVFYMEQFPDAGYGLCSMEQDQKQIFPFQMTPNETFERHYIQGKSVFYIGPLASIIKRDVFEKEGGFANVRHFGDFEFWMRLSMENSTVLMPGGIVWYRYSDGQESSIRKGNPNIAIEAKLLEINHIKSKTCPLTAINKKIAINSCNRSMAFSTLSAFKYFGWSKGMELKKNSKLKFTQLLTYRFNKKLINRII